VTRRTSPVPEQRDDQRRSRMAPNGAMWSESPIFWAGDVRGRTERPTTCTKPPLYIPDEDNNWSLQGQLGTPGSGKRTARTPYLYYTINGDGSGALGDGDPQVLGIRFDPEGNDHHLVWDFLAPGTPWEGYVFEVKHSTGGTGGIVGSNTGGYVQSVSGPSSAPGTEIWTVDPDYHYVTKYGSNSQGWVVNQYRSVGTKICIDMLYINSTGHDVSVKAMRGTDPDQDVYGGGEYDTYNYRGWDGADNTDSAASVGVDSDFVMEIFTTGDGHLHNSGIVADWPCESLTDPAYVLTGPYDGGTGYLDYAICSAWNLGTIEPGQYATMSCAYVMSKLV
jgi:hypothetical protein